MNKFVYIKTCSQLLKWGLSIIEFIQYYDSIYGLTLSFIVTKRTLVVFLEAIPIP